MKLCYLEVMNLLKFPNWLIEAIWPLVAEPKENSFNTQLVGTFTEEVQGGVPQVEGMTGTFGVPDKGNQQCTS